MALRDLLGELRSSAPQAITEPQMNGLNKDMKEAIFNVEATGDMAPLHAVLARVETGAKAAGDAGKPVLNGVQWMRDDLAGHRPVKNTGEGAPVAPQAPAGPPAKYRAPQAPFISPRAIREKNRPPRRDISDTELYRLASEQRARKVNRPRRMLSPAKLAGGHGIQLHYDDFGSDDGQYPDVQRDDMTGQSAAEAELPTVTRRTLVRTGTRANVGPFGRKAPLRRRRKTDA
jgi:hypothetical protein